MVEFDESRESLCINQRIVGRTVLEVSMKGNVLEAELRRARRVTHLGRVFFLGDCGFRGLAYLQDLSMTGCRVVSSPVKETVAKENFWLQGWPDTWRVVTPPTHHGAALRCNFATIRC